MSYLLAICCDFCTLKLLTSNKMCFPGTLQAWSANEDVGKRRTQEEGTVWPVPVLASRFGNLLDCLAGRSKSLAGLAGEVPLCTLDDILASALELLGGPSGLHHKLALYIIQRGLE